MRCRLRSICYFPLLSIPFVCLFSEFSRSLTARDRHQRLRLRELRGGGRAQSSSLHRRREDRIRCSRGCGSCRHRGCSRRANSHGRSFCSDGLREVGLRMRAVLLRVRGLDCRWLRGWRPCSLGLGVEGDRYEGRWVRTGRQN